MQYLCSARRKRFDTGNALAVSLLVAIGAVLRAPLLHGGFWRDEASTYYEVTAHTVRAVVGMVARGELNPPGFFVVEHGWAMLSGSGEIAMKLPSFACSLALIPVTYALAGSLLSQRGAMLAAVCATVSPTSILFAAQARPYAMAALLVGLAMAAYAAALTRVGWRRPLVASTVLFAGALYTHYTAALVIGLLSCGTAVILARGGQRSGIVSIAFALAGIAALFVPWIPAFVRDARIGLPWSPRTTAGTFLAATSDNVTSLMPLASHHSQLGIVLAAALVGFGGAALFGRRRSQSRRHDVIVVFGCCVIAGAAIEALSSMREPRFMFVFAACAWTWFAALIDGAIAAVARWKGPARMAAAALTAGLILGLIPKERDARLIVPLAESGVPALAPTLEDLGRRHRTLYVVAPDYIGPTFGYYVGESTGVRAVGFARWRDPQLFRPAGYLALWTAPGLVHSAERRIAFAMQSYDRLCLLRDRDERDSGLVPFSRTTELIMWLRVHYREVRSTSAFGREESVTMDEFASKRCTVPPTSAHCPCQALNGRGLRYGGPASRVMSVC
ncbi:MAG: glycosyltransferase family 39 protein [Candidatus Eremiobacteraeota bacterium]|nr:glycosyltransferase family 39 protein [Candidatus Eremiobacteraeota bacterium]MBC5802428.1 glycosyltransferase family 39 protein [Candidatus Eremiobacteraeota bacterium]MBC5821617.1 glycosyltransferase family 39 protein [Candidatus Eremiobacteraeota bacterium]